MQTFLELKDFCKLVHLDEAVVMTLARSGSLKYKEENGQVFIEAKQGTLAILPSSELASKQQESEAKNELAKSEMPGQFVERTIGTILNLHEKVLDAKDETLEVLRAENNFLRESLVSLQELYEQDRATIEELNEALKAAREDAEFSRRKYKLMWDKTVASYSDAKG